MRTCDTRQNIMIGRSRHKHAVFQDMYIAVSTLGDTISSMQNSFIAAGFFCFLRCNNRGNKVQGFDVTMQEPCVFQRNQFYFLINVNGVLMANGNPKVSLGTIFQEGMVSLTCTSCNLPVNKIIAGIHFGNHFV